MKNFGEKCCLKGVPTASSGSNGLARQGGERSARAAAGHHSCSPLMPPTCRRSTPFTRDTLEYWTR